MEKSPDPSPIPSSPKVRFSLRALICLVVGLGLMPVLLGRWEPWGVVWERPVSGEVGVRVANNDVDISVVGNVRDSARSTLTFKKLDWHGDEKSSFMFSGSHINPLLNPEDYVGPLGKRVFLNVGLEKPIMVDLDTGKKISHFSELDNKEFMGEIAISPGEELIALYEMEWKQYRIKLFDTTTGSALKTLQGHAAQITHLEFSQDAKFLLSSSRDGSARLWDVEAGRPLKSFSLKGGAFKGRSITDKMRWTASFSPDATRVATNNCGQAELWNVQTGRPIKDLSEGNSNVNWVAFSPDGTLVAAVIDESVIRIFNAEKGNVLTTFTGGEGSGYCEISKDNLQILTNGKGGKSILWSLKSGSLKHQFYGAIAFAPNGKDILVWRGGARFSKSSAKSLWNSILATAGGSPLGTIPSNEGAVQLWRRRRPEGFWGHFVRVEVWAYLVLFGILIRDWVRARKTA